MTLGFLSLLQPYMQTTRPHQTADGEILRTIVLPAPDSSR